ncbi:MAG: hypothetical protein LQ347_002389 [Umbilicaria vellea]|nr:MAG: hypothetical protein LQ347_002389 [Umbilicaria vellea]
MAEPYHDSLEGRHPQRKKSTIPWPLALRFTKGAIHSHIWIPGTLHAIFTIAVVFIDQQLNGHLGLPASIVFRNQTSYNRFWEGRNHLTEIITSVRNLTRSFLACSHYSANSDTTQTPNATDADRAATERVVRILIAILYATKNHLRAEWGAGAIAGAAIDVDDSMNAQCNAEYGDLLPRGLLNFEHQGLGLPLQLSFFVERYIKRAHDQGWFHSPQASTMQVQLNRLVEAYGRMETIRLTPIPVAHLNGRDVTDALMRAASIHQKQVLALFGCVLPFAMVDEMGWWAVPIVTLVIFTLYGIEGIGSQLEDPFGRDKNDIKTDALVEDIRSEISVLLEEWKRTGEKGGEMFMEGEEGG